MAEQNNQAECAAPELLPCPMCANAAKIHDMEEYFMVACECGVNYEGPSPKDCTEAWNRRSAPAAGTVKDAQDAIKPVAWMNPDESCVMDAFLWQKDTANPQYHQPVYAISPEHVRYAERYRWLRDGGIYDMKYADHGAGPEYNTQLWDLEIDAAIEAHNRAGKEQG